MSDRLMSRLRGMVSRAVVSLVNDSLKMQGLQVTLMADQTPDDAEHFQHYGFTSVPLPGAEGIALAVGGSTGHTVVINVDDRRYRVKALQAGEVCLYDDLGHKVTLTRDGIVIDGAGQQVRIINTPMTRLESPLHVTGNITCDGNIATPADVTAGAVSLKTHKHGGVAVGGAQTSTPV